MKAVKQAHVVLQTQINRLIVMLLFNRGRGWRRRLEMNLAVASGSLSQTKRVGDDHDVIPSHRVPHIVPDVTKAKPLLRVPALAPCL